MQYNGHSTNQDLVSLAEKLSKSNSVSFPIAEKTLYANLGSRIIMSAIHEVYGGWKYDDSNQTDFPRATTDLTSGQDDYALPIDTSFVDAVYYQNQNDTTWNRLEPLPLEMIDNEPSDFDTDSTPQYYRLSSNSIIIYPASDFSKDDALMVEYSRDISAFATTDTTKKPGFDQQFHEAVAIYMAWQYSMVNNTATKQNLTLMWTDILERIRRHYQMKWKELFPTRIKIRNDINQYL